MYRPSVNGYFLDHYNTQLPQHDALQFGITNSFAAILGQRSLLEANFSRQGYKK